MRARIRIFHLGAIPAEAAQPSGSNCSFCSDAWIASPYHDRDFKPKLQIVLPRRGSLNFMKARPGDSTTMAPAAVFIGGLKAMLNAFPSGINSQGQHAP